MFYCWSVHWAGKQCIAANYEPMQSLVFIGQYIHLRSKCCWWHIYFSYRFQSTVPSSTMKWLTAVAAVERLGPIINHQPISKFEEKKGKQDQWWFDTLWQWSPELSVEDLRVVITTRTTGYWCHHRKGDSWFEPFWIINLSTGWAWDDQLLVMQLFRPSTLNIIHKSHY